MLATLVSASLDGVTASGMFTAEDLGQSSPFRELKAIYDVSLSCAERLKQRTVKVFTNNHGAARIVSNGSSKVRLQSVTMSIFDFCLSNGISPRSHTGRKNGFTLNLHSAKMLQIYIYSRANLKQTW